MGENSFLPKDVGVIYGGQLAGRGLSGMLNYVDTLSPEGLLGQPLSLWGEIIGAVGGLLGGLFLDYPYNFILTVVGSSLAGNLMDMVISPAPMRIATPTQKTYTPPGTVTTPAVAAKGRYIVA